jgi:serine/threonine-protein kinase RsbW
MAPKLDGEQVGGFGLFIIKSLMDQVEIVSRRGIGTSIRMVKNRSVCNEV